jgi:hypothetical protein
VLIKRSVRWVGVVKSVRRTRWPPSGAVAARI